jgi:hypothetical protein
LVLIDFILHDFRGVPQRRGVKGKLGINDALQIFRKNNAPCFGTAKKILSLADDKTDSRSFSKRDACAEIGPFGKVDIELGNRIQGYIDIVVVKNRSVFVLTQVEVYFGGYPGAQGKARREKEQGAPVMAVPNPGDVFGGFKISFRLKGWLKTGRNSVGSIADPPEGIQVFPEVCVDLLPACGKVVPVNFGKKPFRLAYCQGRVGQQHFSLFPGKYTQGFISPVVAVKDFLVRKGKRRGCCEKKKEKTCCLDKYSHRIHA